MTTPSWRNVEQLSASLDGQLSQADKARLETRLRSSPELAAILLDLRQARTILRYTPKRHPPRNFTLTPKMAGIQPPVPRLVPTLSWASVVAMLVFVFSMGTNLVGKFSFGAAAPMPAAAPMSASGYGVGGGPAETQAPGLDTNLTTPTPDLLILTVPDATALGEALRVSPPSVPAVKAAPEPVNFWPYIWLGLATLLIAAALLIRVLNIHAFHRKTRGSHKR